MDKHEPFIHSLSTVYYSEREDVPVGSDLSHSPFANLRDGRSAEYGSQPNVALADKARGYIYLKPFRKDAQLETLYWDLTSALVGVVVRMSLNFFGQMKSLFYSVFGGGRCTTGPCKVLDS